jgi:hypothetical protein
MIFDFHKPNKILKDIWPNSIRLYHNQMDGAAILPSHLPQGTPSRACQTQTCAGGIIALLVPAGLSSYSIVIFCVVYV